MKKLIFTTITIASLCAVSFAQEAPVAAPAARVKKDLSKEEKKAIKVKQEAETLEALKGAGLTAEEITSANEIMKASSIKSNEMRANDKLTAEEMEAAKKVIYKEKDQQLKTLMGEERYKAYKAIKTKQKEAAQQIKAAE